MKNLAFLFIFTFEMVSAQNKALEQIDSLIQTQDLIYVEEIKLNNLSLIIDNKQVNITDEYLIKNIGKYDKKEFKINEMDDYETIVYSYKKSSVTLFHSDENYFDECDIKDSSIIMNPWGLKVGLEFEQFKSYFPKTYAAIKASEKNESYYLITVRSKVNKDWLSKDLIIYINNHKISRIKYYYGD